MRRRFRMIASSAAGSSALRRRSDFDEARRAQRHRKAQRLGGLALRKPRADARNDALGGELVRARVADRAVHVGTWPARDRVMEHFMQRVVERREAMRIGPATDDDA